MCILMMAFPMSVAPKKVQNGTRKWPQVIPARSNRGLGIWNTHTHTDTVFLKSVGLDKHCRDRVKVILEADSRHIHIEELLHSRSQCRTHWIWLEIHHTKILSVGAKNWNVAEKIPSEQNHDEWRDRRTIQRFAEAPKGGPSSRYSVTRKTVESNPLKNNESLFENNDHEM